MRAFALIFCAVILGCCFLGCEKSRYKVTTLEAADMMATRATLKGSASRFGFKTISERGFCYGTRRDPGFGDQVVLSRIANDGKAGNIEATIENLAPNTTYYARAYAKLGNGKVIFGNQKTFDTNDQYREGDTGPGGGIVFYINTLSGPSWKFQEAVLLPVPAPWGCDGVFIDGAVNSQNGEGPVNTKYILAKCSEPGIAAALCSELELNGKSDWFLPTAFDLQSLSKSGLGNFSALTCWTSTRLDNTTSFVVVMKDGSFAARSKLDRLPVIAVRQF